MGRRNEMRAIKKQETLRAALCGLFISLFVMTPCVASAQDQPRSNVVLDVAKAVVLDPTTYMPATLSYTSLRMDWKTSQTLFQQGWLEQNSRFTVTGRPNDRPISFEAGNRQITRMALMHLQESVVNNVSTQIFERVLTEKYPQHRKLFKTLGWVERIGFASYVSYLASANHFKQSQRNMEMARERGYLR
jgi:hypothetical protein